MNVDFLSGMIKELMLDHDSLSLPGLGTFVAEEMPASFSDRGYTLNPPYRRLVFSEKRGNDTLLCDLYAGANPQAPEEAASVLETFLQELRDELINGKSVDLPGLGRLRATRDNHFFFVADEALDISPDTCGLTTVSLKSHRPAVLPEVPVAPVAHAQPEVQTQPKAAEPQKAPAEPESPAQPAATEQAESPAEPASPANPRRGLRWYGWAGIALAACALLLAGFVALSRIAPDFTDKILYTPEELAIINYPDDGLGLPG